MKHILFSLILLISTAAPAFAHQHHEGVEAQQTNGRPDKAQREKWFKEAKEMKHRFLVKELNLKKEQQQEFFAAYDSMEAELHQVQSQTRSMERRVYQLGDQATELDYEKATDALYEAKEKEAAIEKNYRERFKKILTPRQMFLLKGAERKFTQELMNRRQNIKDKH